MASGRVSSSHLQIDENDSRLRISWNSATAAKNKAAGWAASLFLGPGLTMVGVFVNIGQLVVVGAVITLAMIVGAIYGRLAPRRMLEWIEVSREAITFGSNYHLSPSPKTVTLDGVATLAFGYYHFPASDVNASGIQLLLFPRGEARGHESHHPLAAIVSEQTQADIFNLIARYVAEHSIPLQLAAHSTDQMIEVRDGEPEPEEETNLKFLWLLIAIAALPASGVFFTVVATAGWSGAWATVMREVPKFLKTQGVELAGWGILAALVVWLIGRLMRNSGKSREKEE